MPRTAASETELAAKLGESSRGGGGGTAATKAGQGEAPCSKDSERGQNKKSRGAIRWLGSKEDLGFRGRHTSTQNCVFTVNGLHKLNNAGDSESTIPPSIPSLPPRGNH